MIEAHVGIVSVLRRYCVGAISAGLIGVAATVGPGSAALANADFSVWREMTESCVTVVTDQSVDGLAQYLPIKNSVAKSDSIARVSDPGGTVFLSAVFEGDWFMCTLTAERMSKSDVIELTDGWTSYTSARLEISSNRQLDLSGRSILIPASVTCGDEGAEIVVYATRSDDVFMVVVTSELPESASDPCVERT